MQILPRVLAALHTHIHTHSLVATSSHTAFWDDEPGYTEQQRLKRSSSPQPLPPPTTPLHALTEVGCGGRGLSGKLELMIQNWILMLLLRQYN